MKTILAILALSFSGCALTGTITTPYGSVSRGSDGKTNVALDLSGFAK